MDIRSLVELKENPNIAEFRPGDTVRVHAKVIEGDRERVQAFEGVVIRFRRGGLNSNFTVRRVSHGVGVERTFPLYSPLLEKVEVMRLGRVRRAKLYYLRKRVGKAARIKASTRWRYEAQPLEEEALEEEGEEYIEEEEEEEAAEEEEEAEGEAAEVEGEEAEGEEEAIEAEEEMKAEASGEAAEEAETAAEEAEEPEGEKAD